jgi:hypothetical protein
MRQWRTEFADGRTAMSIAIDPGLRSLAEVEPGETVQVERIPLDSLKDLCWSVRIGEGDILRCRRTSREVCVLETETGNGLLVDGDWAHFIQVRSVSPAGPPRA